MRARSVPLLMLFACGDPFDGLTEFDQYVKAEARFLFAGAHPDDETLIGPLFAYACIVHGRDCHIAVFTRGEAGRCALEEQLCQDLGAVRAAEMAEVAAKYGVTLHQATFSNGPANQPGDPDAVEAIRARWQSEGDPAAWLAGVFDTVQPDVVVTFDPDNGFTGHFEHRLVSRFTNEVGGGRELTIFNVLNHYEDLEPITGRDPGIATEIWPLKRSCGEQTCLQISVDIAKTHRSQVSSILGLLLLFPDKFENGFLRITPPR